MSSTTTTTTEQKVVYEMFIPCVQRKFKIDPETKKRQMTETNEPIYDKEATERQIFWVFKQLDWGYISRVQVFGFDDKSKKNATARISYTRLNANTHELVEQLNQDATVDVNHSGGVWHVVKYSRREPKASKPTMEPQVTFKIRVKPTDTSATDKPRPHTPPMEPPTEFKPIVKPSGTVVKPSANKFKILNVEGSSSESEEPK
jgi:hypothetical protein